MAGIKIFVFRTIIFKFLKFLIFEACWINKTENSLTNEVDCVLRLERYNTLYNFLLQYHTINKGYYLQVLDFKN